MCFPDAIRFRLDPEDWPVLVLFRQQKQVLFKGHYEDKGD